MSSQRLQKVLAQAGIASRRAAESLITEGRVRVNGRIVRELGARADPNRDRVEVDGKRLVAERPVYLLMHKPRGVVTTLDDPEGRKTVKDLLRNVHERVFPIGRLDFQTSGVLLLTNDGALAQALLHPTRAVPKTYNAKLQGTLDDERLALLRGGVVLDDGHKTGPAEVKILRTDPKHTSVEITIAEGKNRQIHRMGEAIGRTVLRLTRISFAGLTLEGMRPGQIRTLSALEVSDLKQKYVHRAKKPKRVEMMFLGAEVDAEAELDVPAAPAEPPLWSKSKSKAMRSLAVQPPAHEPARGTRTERSGSRTRRTERSGAQVGARTRRTERSGAQVGARKTTRSNDTQGKKRPPAKAKAAKRGRAMRGKGSFAR